MALDPARLACCSHFGQQSCFYIDSIHYCHPVGGGRGREGERRGERGEGRGERGEGRGERGEGRGERGEGRGERERRVKETNMWW